MHTIFEWGAYDRRISVFEGGAKRATFCGLHSDFCSAYYWQSSSNISAISDGKLPSYLAIILEMSFDNCWPTFMALQNVSKRTALK